MHNVITFGAGSSAVITTACEASSNCIRMVSDGMELMQVWKAVDFNPMRKLSSHWASAMHTWSSPDTEKSALFAYTVRNMPFFCISTRLLSLLENRLTRRRMSSISFLSNTT